MVSARSQPTEYRFRRAVAKYIKRHHFGSQSIIRTGKPVGRLAALSNSLFRGEVTPFNCRIFFPARRSLNGYPQGPRTGQAYQRMPSRHHSRAVHVEEHNSYSSPFTLKAVILAR